MSAGGEIDLYELDRTFCLSGTLNYTKYFFYQQYNRKFVVNDHHIKITDALDKVLKGEITRLIINIAPRYSKTELAVKNFISKGLAKNPASKFIHLSYSSDLALDNASGVKDIVNLPMYQALFPEVQIKKGSDSVKKWWTTMGGGMYSTAAGGQVTGFGAGRVDDEVEVSDVDDIMEMMPNSDLGFAGALIIDDPIKPDDADSETVREKVNGRFDSTIINRVNSRNTPIIIIMQRLHERDLCGYVMENYPGEWTVLSLPSIILEEGQKLTEGKPLWPFKHTLVELLKMYDVDPINFGRQYMQNPQPRKGFLYKPFGTYTIIPESGNKMSKSYTDTADTGTDYLCSISYIETETFCYVTDVIYTQEAMETTEPLVAKQLTQNSVDLARVESNNGGRGFARNVESQCRLMRNYRTGIEWFHQSQNKQVRIFTRSAEVNNLIIFPVGWEIRWPLFHKHVVNYSAKGENKNDDAQDTLTGIAEFFGKDVIHVDASDLSVFA